MRSTPTSGGATPDGQLQGAAALEPDLLLVGTVVDSAGGNRAVILDVEEKKQLLLREGEMVNGVSISQISSGKVIISRAGRNERLDLAEPARIQALLAGSASSQAAPALQINAVAPQGSSPEPGESAEEGQRIDLNRLNQPEDKIIVKGRINKNI